jgi:hypothetical protein
VKANCWVIEWKQGGKGPWRFYGAHPTLHDANVYSVFYRILHPRDPYRIVKYLRLEGGKNFY